MRKKKALINSLFSMFLEVITIICGFILPRLFIKAFGSEINGLVSSISGFIGYITLLQTGVGTVAKSAMYTPLARKSNDELCIIVHTVERFFRRIAVITVIYVGCLFFIFPTVIAPEAGSLLFTGSLVVFIGIGTFAQYYWGITYQMLLEADQMSYVYSAIQILTVVLNTVISVILIKLGCSVQWVKLGSAMIFVVRPVVLCRYVVKKYGITKTTPIDNNLIKQRWDGFAQGIAYFIHSKTDVFVLTLFARFNSNISLKLVSVYSVYALVTTGLTALVRSIGRAVTSALGNIIALGEQERLNQTFNMYNTFMHIIGTALFSTASICVFNFIGVYVRNVSDIDYIRKEFGLILIAAEYLYCIRLPYNSVIYAAGKFRETKRSAIIEAIINILISVVLVGKIGLTGVAIGTFTAMLYRTISFVVFLNQQVIYISILSQVKRYAVSLGIYIGLIALSSLIPVVTESFLAWGIYAACVCCVCTCVAVGVNFAFERKDTRAVIKALIHWEKKSENY